MHAKSVLFVVSALDRPIVQAPLLPTLGTLPFLILESLEHATERLAALAFCHPATPLYLQLFLTVANDLLLRAYGTVQTCKKILIILPVHRTDIVRLLVPGCIVVAIGVEFAKFVALFVQANARLAGCLSGLPFLGLRQRQDFFNFGRSTCHR